MFKLSLSRREKILAGAMGVVLLVVAWYFLVFQNVDNQLLDISNKMASVDEEKLEADAQVIKQRRMQGIIDSYRENGLKSRTLPDFDNIAAVTRDLNVALSAADTYSLSFDKIDKETPDEYITRGVKIEFTCGSLETAESIIGAIASTDYPCSVDSVAFTNRAEQTGSRLPKAEAGAGDCSVSMHVTFKEKKP